MTAASPINQTAPSPSATRRRLLVRDSLTFLALLTVTVILYGITLFLFRSFQGHRNDLGIRWSRRGAADLNAGQPAQAVAALRAALSYDPDNRSYQLLLAEALSNAGHLDEANSYFLNLWDTRPGDGFINLQLARLARRKSESQQAIEYYRAAIFGAWSGSGLENRRAARLELADYLTQLHDLSSARAELLIGAASSPDEPRLDLLFGNRLEDAGDPQDALTYFRKALDRKPHNLEALEKAGRVSYDLGDYAAASRFLKEALTQSPKLADAPNKADLLSLEQDALRMTELDLSRELPARERGRHLLLASTLAQGRLAQCSSALAPKPATAPAAGSPSTAPASASPLQDLIANWKQAETPQNRKAVLSDGDVQDQVMDLIFATEQRTAKLCGAPTGDNALLLKLATAAASQAQTELP